jgi:hypothetical protein
MSIPVVADIAQEARRSRVVSGRQGTAEAHTHEEAGRGRRCA